MSYDSIPLLDLSPEIEAIGDEIKAAISRVVDSGRFILGPEVEAFEEEVAHYLGVKHAVGVNSGTDALVIGLRALGIGPGDEVITTPFTFFATAEAISIIGATPVFVDIDPVSYNIDPALIESAITPQTRAVLPVHLFGRPANMKRIMAIARQHDLAVLEDCAQAFGAQYRFSAEDDPAYVGTIGDVGAFSFFPSKNLGAYGDGGLVVTDDDELAEAARMLRKHGGTNKYHNVTLGYNSRLDALQAAVLRVKLKHIDAYNSGRRSVAKEYHKLLGPTAGLVPPPLVEGHVFHQYTIRLTDAVNHEVQRDLQRAGISAKVYYPTPCHQLPVYDDLDVTLPVAEDTARHVLSLPIWPQMPLSLPDRVATALQRSLAGEPVATH